jgi:DNA-binding NarL/FixJ family response regulator
MFLAARWPLTVVSLAPERGPIEIPSRFGTASLSVLRLTDLILSKCIRSAHSGQIWASNEELEFILQVLTQLKPVQRNDGVGMGLLTRREQMVTRLVVEGMKNRQIAVTLQLTEHTVSNYLYRIFEKIGDINPRRTDLVRAQSPTQSHRRASHHVGAGLCLMLRMPG